MARNRVYLLSGILGIILILIFAFSFSICQNLCRNPVILEKKSSHIFLDIGHQFDEINGINYSYTQDGRILVTTRYFRFYLPDNSAGKPRQYVQNQLRSALIQVINQLDHYKIKYNKQEYMQLLQSVDQYIQYGQNPDNSLIRQKLQEDLERFSIDLYMVNSPVATEAAAIISRIIDQIKEEGSMQ